MCRAEKIRHGEKRHFWNNALSLEEQSLYYATVFAFAEGFAPPDSWVGVFAILAPSDLVIFSFSPLF